MLAELIAKGDRIALVPQVLAEFVHSSSTAKHYVELWPYLVMAMLLTFLADVAVRRWEHVTGIWEMALTWMPRMGRAK